MLSILIIAVLVWYFFFYRKKQKEKEQAKIQDVLSNTPIGLEAEPVLQEAINVINDFLNAGSVIQLFNLDNDYSGCVHFLPEVRNRRDTYVSEYGIQIFIADVDDLSVEANKYPKMLTNNPSTAIQYESFMNRYKACFNPDKKEYVYHTINTVGLAGKQPERLIEMLRQRVATECPLADFEGSILYNKSVNH